MSFIPFAFPKDYTFQKVMHGDVPCYRFILASHCLNVRSGRAGRIVRQSVSCNPPNGAKGIDRLFGVSKLHV